MGELWGTCGHRITGKELEHNGISIKEYDETGRQVVCSMVVCDKCLKWWKKRKLILHNQKEEEDWLNEKTR